MLEQFITSRLRHKLVTFFVKYPETSTHVRGIAQVLDEDPGNVQRELTKFQKAGFVQSTKVRNTRVYSADQSFPIFPELQSIVKKTEKADKNS